mmetsp:Transcript_30160/g.41492  ORF Transcript_30160/g.41492 Transcript_30160/m.41492 type:complete len:80 (-) Transcript_30160:221-460(-)
MDKTNPLLELVFSFSQATPMVRYVNRFRDLTFLPAAFRTGPVLNTSAAIEVSIYLILSCNHQFVNRDFCWPSPQWIDNG